MKRVLVLLMTAMLALAGCAKNVEATPDAASPDGATADEATSDEALFDPLEYMLSLQVETEPPTEPPTLEELVQARYDEILNGKLKDDYASLDNVKPYDQIGTGMQAACESLALTAAINHFGYDLDADDVVDDYLVYSDNYVTGYCGNPRRFYDGSGVYPPGLIATAWNFIEENDAPIYPFDTTGLSLEELFKFVDAGCPVLIWTTYDEISPRIEQYREYEGIKYPWYENEHCVCLYGYHLGDNEVKVANSWKTYEDWKGRDNFERIYDECGQFSMVLMGTSGLR